MAHASTYRPGEGATTVDFIRLISCGMLPDGIRIPKSFLRVPIMHGLVKPAEDDETGEPCPGEYRFHCRYNRDEEAAAVSLIRMVEKGYKRYGYPPGMLVEVTWHPRNVYAKGTVLESFLDPRHGDPYAAVEEADGRVVVVEARWLTLSPGQSLLSY